MFHEIFAFHQEKSFSQNCSQQSFRKILQKINQNRLNSVGSIKEKFLLYLSCFQGEKGVSYFNYIKIKTTRLYDDNHETLFSLHFYIL